jgi:hypothetical protein
MRVETITCDECSCDLTTTSNVIDYRLGLVVQSREVAGGYITAMGKSPAIGRDHHFCGLQCLDTWSDRRRYRSNVYAEHWASWRRDNGTSLGGTMTTYPAPPDEVINSWDTDATAKALAKFPHSFEERQLSDEE